MHLFAAVIYTGEIIYFHEKARFSAINTHLNTANKVAATEIRGMQSGVLTSLFRKANFCNVWTIKLTFGLTTVSHSLISKVSFQYLLDFLFVMCVQ